jgi:hypothetical protein
MAAAVGQVVGYYTNNPANQIAGFGIGPYPATICAFNADGSVVLCLHHITPPAIINVWKMGSPGMGPGQDYWQTLITGQQ